MITRALRSPSLARRAITRALAVAALILAAASTLVFLSVMHERRESVLGGLEAFARSNAREQEAVFRSLERFHRDATASLRARLAHGSDAEIAVAFDRNFPLRADGTRRSRPQLYDGAAFGPADDVRGIGAFIAHGMDLSIADKRLLLAAFQTIRSLGPGYHAEVDNFGFFDLRDRLIVYAPDRADRLSYYRDTAPASFSIVDRDFVHHTRKPNNPDRGLRCIDLRPILSDREQRVWTSGCQTPIDIDGRQVGAWTSTLLLDRFVASLTRGSPPHSTSMIVSRAGRLIAHSTLTRQNARETGRYIDIRTSGDPQLRAVWTAVRGKPPGTAVRLPDSGDLVFVERLAGPGWYSVVVYPNARLRAHARKTALTVLGVGLAVVSVLAGALWFILLRQVVRPLGLLTDGARRLSTYVAHRDAGPHEVALPVGRRDEVGVMARAFAAMADRVVFEQALLESKVAERTAALERLATTDDLTGLANRRSFLAAIEAEIARTLRTDTPAALALFDVDYFKRINDGHGHAGGDAVLRTLAHRWRFGAREIDLCGRLGGEEFALLLLDVDAALAFAAAERMRHLGQCEAVLFDDAYIAFTLSAGVTAILPDDTVKSVLARADVALYRAKAAGRDRTVLAGDNGALQALMTSMVG